MSAYIRPPIDPLILHDADGQLIDYGNRWSDSPPEETYSVDTHPERFAPIHTIADALIAHLRDTYDVDLIESVETATDLLRPPPDVVRAVRVRPNDPACAALTFVFTSYPGVWVHAGLVHDLLFPVCGCDACDSTWEAEADRLERQVVAVATGHFREGIGRGPRPCVSHAFTYPDGANSGQSRAEGFPAERLAAAMPLLRGLSDAWPAWPRRRPEGPGRG